MYEKVVNWSRKYGDPITVWVGPRPFVIASTKESFKDISGPLRNLVAGRAETNLGAAQTRGFEVCFRSSSVQNVCGPLRLATDGRRC